MRKFLSIMILGLMLAAGQADAQNQYWTTTGSRLSRLVFNKNTQNTGLTYALYGTGQVQIVGRTGGLDSCVFQVDTASCVLGVLKATSGTKTAYLVLDSVSTLQAATSVTTTSPTQAFTATTSVTATTPFVQIVSTGTPLKIVGNSTVNATGASTLTMTNAAVSGNPQKYLKIVQKATTGGADSVYIMPLWRVSP